MLTWWMQADVHFNEDDQFQQNLTLTLQAMAMENEDNKVKITIHKEVESDINVIFLSQLGTWLAGGMKKLAIFSTGKGDILFRVLFTCNSNTFLTAERECKNLKAKLETSLFRYFGVCMSSSLIRVSLVAIEGFSTPTIPEAVGKALILFVTTDENNIQQGELNGHYELDYFFHLQDYRTREVDEMITEHYSGDPVLTSPSDYSQSSYSVTESMEEVFSPTELLEMFDD